MSSQPVKRLRRSARLAGPSTACPIVDLPLELMEKVVSHLSYEELYTLASTSKPFQNTYRLRAVLMKLERYAMCDYVNDSTDGGWERELFCLSDAQPGEFGWEPFFMMISEDSLHIEDGKQVLDVTGISPAFERFDLEGPTNSYLFIKQIKSRVWLKSQYFEKAHHFQTDLDESESIDWDSELAGRLVRATPKLLKSRFKWPGLRTPYQYEIPCPRCEVTYKYAKRYKREMDEEIEEEAYYEEYHAYGECDCCG